MNAKMIALIIPVLILCVVIDFIRREKLTFKYAGIWICLCIVAIFFALFDQALFYLSALFGFELPSNFIFFGLLTFFVFLSLLLTLFLCQQNRRNDIMAQKLGMLEAEVEQLKKRHQ